MKTQPFWAIIALGSPFVPAAVQAAPSSPVSTPAPGSRERAELMDALRGPFAQTHHETATFQVNRLKVGGGYAYLDATALGASGKPVGSLAPMGGAVSAFYQKKNGHWTVVKWGSYGGTDLVDYARQHYPNAPVALYPGSVDGVRAASNGAVYTPKPGSRERAELMDALRGPFAAKYHKTPTFQVERLLVGNGYAYLDATALAADGKAVVGQTKSDSGVSAFYRKRNGHWTVLKWAVRGGASVEDYGLKHYPQAPVDLFP